MRGSLDLKGAKRIARERIENREKAFLLLAERAIFNNPRSAYRKMLDEAGIGLDKLTGMANSLQVEGALEELRRQGVYVTYEEYKAVNAYGAVDTDKFGKGVNFDNPRLKAGFEMRSSGSRSPGTRFSTDFEFLSGVAVQRRLRMEELGGMDVAEVRYFPILPAGTGMNRVLIGNYINQRQAKWFTPIDPRKAPFINRIQTAYLLAAVKMAGGDAPKPEYVPLSDVEPIVRWIAEAKERGERVSFHAYSSSNVRVCATARRLGLDVSGTLFHLIGEPVTQAKHDAVVRAGGVPIVSYGIAETGFLANICPHSQSADEMHFFTDSFALTRHRRKIPPGDQEVEPFLLTSLLPGTPKVMLNVELDDYGEVYDRPCDCIWGRLGLTKRISRLRSFVKLTTEGMTFAGTNLIRVLEQELPVQFGGGPSDYQLLEEEDEKGRARLSLRISPHVGEIREDAVLDLLYKRIRSGSRDRRLYGDVWKEGGTVRVAREEPLSTRSGKILPFHTLRAL